MVSRRVYSIAILAAIVSMLLGTPTVLAHSPVTQNPAIQLWHITFSDQADLNRLANELDVWEVDHSIQRLLAPLTASQATALAQTHQIALAPDQSPLEPPTASAAQTTGIPGYACYRTVDETFATLDHLALDYPQLVKQVDIGDSWDKAKNDTLLGGDPTGDDLRAIVLSNHQRVGPKFRFMLMGAIHAREYVTAELALRFAESLLQRYGRDATATWLLDYGELHLLPIANPDGRRIAEAGLLWRKNTNRADAACSLVSLPFSSYGVDLNRNSSFHWSKCEGFSCSSANSCHQTYRGVSPASEPEVAAIESYMRAIFADQRGTTLSDSAPATTPGVFISLHSYGRLVLFPWGWTTQHAPNGHDLATFARRLGYHLDYRVCQAGGVGCLYQTDGTTDDWAYGELGLPSFTIEVGTNFFQSCTDFENGILEKGLDALEYAFRAAPLPYQLAEGPEVLDLVVSPQDVGQDATQHLRARTHVAITATASAKRMAPLSGSGSSDLTEPTDSIGTTRLTIDQLPWSIAPATLPVSAVDGQYDSSQEAIATSAEIACLPSGRHTLYLQAQDTAGDWGIVSAEFITVTNNTPFTATLQNNHGSTMIGKPITYTLTLTNTSATTATYRVEISEGTSGDLGVTVTPSTPITLAASSFTQIAVAVTPTNNTAGTSAPTVLTIRSVEESVLCRQYHVTTQVSTWKHRQILSFIRRP